MAQLFHQQSKPCGKEELSYWTVPATQTVIEDYSDIEYRPLSSISDSGSIEFNVPGDSQDYIDPSKCSLYVKLKIVKPDGSDLDVADNLVAPENLLLHNLWSQVELSLNNVIITPSNNTYEHRAYLETVLNYGKETKETELSGLSLYAKDTESHFNAGLNENMGFRRRQEKIAGSRVIELLGRLHIDMCEQNRLVPNGVQLKFRLIRNSNAFSLHNLSDPEVAYKIKLLDVSLFVRKVKINPSVLMSNEKQLLVAPMAFPIKRLLVNSTGVSAGMLSVQRDNLFQGQLPNRLVIGFVSNEAYQGSYVLNPFEFGHQNICHLALHLGGKTVPAKPLILDFENKLYARAYKQMFDGLGKSFLDESNDISYQDFGGGYAFFVFDLTADYATDSDYAQVIKHGNLRLEVHFKVPLAQSVNIVYLGEFQNCIEIDHHRNVTVDFQQ